MTRTTTVLPLCALLALGTTACGDSTSATGELGRIDYSLYTYYEVDAGRLTDVSILAGHPQRLSCNLTTSGEDDAESPGEIVHSVSPASSASVWSHDGDSDSDYVADVYVTVEAAGDYTIESHLDGELFDTITLHFDVPTALDAVTWVREPGEPDFTKTQADSPVVSEGTQVAYVPYPLDAVGDRIAGTFAATLTADPAGSVVTAYDLDGIYEDGIWGSEVEDSVYFIEPGEITLTMLDEVNDVDFAQTFQVSPVSP